MTEHLYIGMTKPYVLRAIIKASPDFDPVVAAAADAGIVLVVRKPATGAEVEWPATVEASSSASVTLKHSFVASDLDERGVYTLWARFRFTDGRELRTRVGKTPSVLDKNQPAI